MLALASVSRADDLPLKADEWVTNAVMYPPGWEAFMVDSNQFAFLHAEVIAGRLRVVLPSEGFPTSSHVRVHWSIDDVGHWPARDWESGLMNRGIQTFETVIRVTDLDVPVVYFTTVSGPETKAAGGQPRLASPMRLCRPALAGMEEASHVFWPFLEGFEESLASWRLISSATPPLAADPESKNGQAALRVTLPSGRNSVTIVTTRVRGWHASVRGATGFRVWLRTRSGPARVTFAATAHSGTPRRQVATLPRDVSIDSRWQAVEAGFDEFPGFASAGLDLLAIEFIGQGPQEFLVDDLQLLGRWRLDP
jgi:hypothetical protein